MMIFAILGVLSFLVFYLLTWISAKRKPDSVDFGRIKTFRDMVNYIVDGDSQ